MSETRSLAQVGYEAFMAAMDARGHRYRPWAQLSEYVQAGWAVAADAIVEDFLSLYDDPPTPRRTP